MFDPWLRGNGEWWIISPQPAGCIIYLLAT
jgi:hypothetical protein